jgi:outer membrane protein assembly factor BamB
VQIAPQATHITCQYCNNSSLIQRGAKPADPTGQYRVIQVSPASVIWPVISIGAVVAMASIGGAVAFAVSAKEAAPAASSPFAGALAQLAGAATSSGRFQFSDHPLLADVNHDGAADVVAKSGVPGGSTWIAAYDGRDGKEIWRTAELTKDAADGIGVRVVAGNRVVTVDSLGKVQAYDLANGQPAWAALLGERARGSVCAGDGWVRIRAMDDTVHDLDLASGRPASVAKNAPCKTVASSSAEDGNGVRMLDWAEFEKNGLPSLHSLEGTTAYRALVPDAGGTAIMLGTKAKGTQVAMITAVSNKKALWQQLVPAVDPMTTSVNVLTQIAALDSGRVAIPYNMAKSGDGVRMACFDVASGRRLWDVEVHKKTQVNGGIAMTAHEVFFSSWTALYVLSADTGRLRYTVGTEF